MTQKSRLQLALEERARHEGRHHVDSLFGGDGKLPEMVVRIPTKAEEMRAIVMAHKDATELAKAAGSSADEAKRDADLVSELKLINVLFFACRDADDPRRSAFEHPLWMRDNLDSDQLGSLLRLVEQERANRGPAVAELSRDMALAFRDAVLGDWESTMPERALLRMDPTFMASFCAYVLKLWHDSEKAAEPAAEEPKGDDAQG